MNKDVLIKVKFLLEKESSQAVLADIRKMGTSSEDIFRKRAESFAKSNREMQRHLAEINKETHKGKGLADEFGLAFRRAFIVAPVWMVGRAMLQEIIGFFKEGTQYAIDNSKAMLKVAESLGSIGENSSEVEGLNQMFHKLSVESGESVSNIANSFVTLKRIIGSTSDTILALNQSIKLAEATGEDLNKISEAMGFISKSSKGANLENLTAQIFAAGAGAPGGVMQLMNQLKEMAPTMQLLDLPIEKVVTVLEKLNQAGIKTSRSLQTGMMKLFGNLTKYASDLGIEVNKNMSDFEIFTKVLQTLGSTMSQKKVSGGALETIREIFGAGQRGAAIPIGLLSKDIENLMKALNEPVDAEENLYKMNQQMNVLETNVSHQLEVFGNLKKQAGEAFVVGIAGGDQLATTIQNLNVAMEQGVRIAGNYGVILSYILSLGTKWQIDDQLEKARQAKQTFLQLEQLSRAKQGKLSSKEIMELLGEISVNASLDKNVKEQALKYLQQEAIALRRKETILLDINKIESIVNPGNIEATTEEIKQYEEKVKIINSISDYIESDTSELIRQEESLRAQQGMLGDITDQEARRFELAKAIYAEQRKQEDLSALVSKSKSLPQLQKTMETFNPEVMRSVSEYIGLDDPNLWSKLGSRAKDALKEIFPEQARQGEMADWAKRMNIKTPEKYKKEKEILDRLESLKEAGFEVNITLGVDGEIENAEVVNKLLKDISIKLPEWLKSDANKKVIINTMIEPY